MKEIVREIMDYCRQLHPGVTAISILLLSGMVYANYNYGWDNWLRAQDGWVPYAGWYLIFLAALSVPYGLTRLMDPARGLTPPSSFFALLLTAPALFSWKMVMYFNLYLAESPYLNLVWNAIVYWPIKLGILLFLIWIIWMLQGRPAHRYGLAKPPPSWKPYFSMLVIMVPLILLAATRPDFTEAYPRWQGVAYPGMGLPTRAQTLLFETAYGMDFLGIELFFRGFLVLAFARYAGTAAILPMAMFYCTIHFGKPLGECISSFFGGTLLGVVTYHTQSIWGGFMVHVGIAWMMEAAGWMAM